jgi:predicted dinucleotide-binding enzyme
LPGIISNSRGSESLKALVAEIGGSIRAGTREEAAQQDIVLVAVPWSKLSEVPPGLPSVNDRIVIDANNAIEPPLFQPVELHGQASTTIASKLQAPSSKLQAPSSYRVVPPGVV